MNVLADVKLFEMHDRGAAPVFSGLKTTFKLENQIKPVPGEIILPVDLKMLDPGEQKVVTVRFNSEKPTAHLEPGIRFSFHEGENTLGVGKILEVT